MAFRGRLIDQWRAGNRGSRVFRKSVRASLLSFVLLPSVAGALGLGGIRTQSALYEPLLAQIDLTDIQADELDTLKVVLASDAEFAKEGVERAFFLSDLKFQPRVSSKGRAVIQVTSQEPIREPFLDFLIEANWPKGRLVKEFTVLLDPPVSLDRPPPPGTRIAQPPAWVDISAFPMRYGPVKKGASLWRIARHMARASGATVAQTAMALYRTNPKAFIRGDINKIKVDTVLEIPTAEELFALDAAAADRELKAALRGERVAATPLTDIRVALGPDDRLEIADTANSDRRAQGSTIPLAPPKPVQVPTTDETAGVSPQTPSSTHPSQIDEPSTLGETEPGLAPLREDLLLVQEAAESTRQETRELRRRIQELERQLKDMQRLLELNSQRYTTLQVAQTGQLEEADSEAKQVVRSEEESLSVSEKAERNPGDAAPTPKDSLTPSIPGPDAEETIKRGSPESEPSPERAFWESIPQLALASALAVTLLLLILGWTVSKRRKGFEGILTPRGPPPEHPPARSAVTPDRVGATQSAVQTAPTATSGLQDSSTYSEFGRLGYFTEEGSILSEADVYIAYGRYGEAELLLKEEIQRSPERLDIKYKLAETYFGAGNLRGLEELSARMEQAGDDRADLDQWQRLNAMLETLKGSDTEKPGPRVAVDPERSPISTRAEPAPQPRPISPPRFDLGSSRESGEAPRLSGFRGAPNAARPQADSPELLSADRDLQVEDLEITESELKIPPISEESVEVSKAMSELELRLRDLEDTAEQDLPGVLDSAPPLEPLTLDVLSEIPAESDTDSLQIPPLSTDTLEGDMVSPRSRTDSDVWDEVATKIDLARAYLEMEDPEAARIILEEVDKEGNKSQRAEARELMERLR
jgi:pilus assembly protein FimV